jgi:glycosyltransferase involved in cell wall biosynthesis
MVLWGPWLSTNFLVQKIQRIFLASENIIPMFYYNIHKEEFKNIGITNSSSFVAINTIAIESSQRLLDNRSADLCFIGSLNKRKKLDVVLNILHSIKTKGLDFVFHIVGDGPELSNLKERVSVLQLNDRVHFHGRITESDYLNKIISQSRLSISYGQAGLSVLHSFALGTPFITMSNAISGGEISCIQNGVNGYICQSEDELEYWITSCLTDFDITLAKNALDYYCSFASKEIWCANVINGLNSGFQK